MQKSTKNNSAKGNVGLIKAFGKEFFAIDAFDGRLDDHSILVTRSHVLGEYWRRELEIIGIESVTIDDKIPIPTTMASISDETFLLFHLKGDNNDGKIILAKARFFANSKALLIELKSRLPSTKSKMKLVREKAA